MRDVSARWAIRCVWLRYFDVFRKDLVYGLTTSFAEPLLYLTSFGFGMGALVGEITVDGNTVSYRKFVFAGIVAQSVMFQSFFDSAYGSFIRMYYQRIFKAIATTPITLSEVLWGELLWDASKATFSASIVLLLGSITGDFNPLGAVCTLPVVFFAAFLFSGLGLWTASIAQSIEQISYPQYLLIFPMFLFCGVYFPITQFPEFLQKAVWIFPVTSLISLIRTLTLGFTFQWWAIPILIFWCILFVTVSRRTMTKRLIK